MRWPGRLAAVAGLALIGALLAWSLWPAPVTVEAATVRRGNFEETVVEDARTRVCQRYVVAAPLAGTLLRIGLTEGDSVSAGDLVAAIAPNRAPLLDPRAREEARQRVGAAEAAVGQAEAAVGQAEAVWRQAEVDAERSRTLASQGTVPRAKLEHDLLAADTARQQLEASRAAREAARHERELARAALFAGSEGEGAVWEVRAPVAGRVLRLLRKSETPVQLGTPLVELADIADLEVMAEVLTTDAVRIRPGDAVLITDWGGEGVLEGRVQRVEPGAFTKVSALGVDEQRTVVVVDLTSPPALWRRLGDGYRVTVGIVVAALQGATLVPAGALFRDGEGWALFALVEGRAEKRRVTLAGRGETEAAVTEGVAPGDTVIVFPGDAVAEGVRVRPR